MPTAETPTPETFGPNHHSHGTLYTTRHGVIICPECNRERAYEAVRADEQLRLARRLRERAKERRKEADAVHENGGDHKHKHHLYDAARWDEAFAAELEAGTL